MYSSKLLSQSFPTVGGLRPDSICFFFSCWPVYALSVSFVLALSFPDPQLDYPISPSCSHVGGGCSSTSLRPIAAAEMPGPSSPAMESSPQVPYQVLALLQLVLKGSLSASLLFFSKVGRQKRFSPAVNAHKAPRFFLFSFHPPPAGNKLMSGGFLRYFSVFFSFPPSGLVTT